MPDWLEALAIERTRARMRETTPPDRSLPAPAEVEGWNGR